MPPTYSMRTTTGVKATVSLPESSQDRVRGAVTRVAESVDSSNRTMLAEIELDNHAHLLQSGSYAQVTLETKQRGAAWTVPTSA